MKYGRFIRGTLVSLVPLTVAVSAQAQVATSLMEEMIVTGSRSPERIDEVPASVTLISVAEIAEQMQFNSEISQLLSVKVPGMGPSTGSSSNSGQTLRGRAPLILIDGVPQSTPLRNGSLGVRSIDSAAIERIEVIKGATSIYGNGASGGVINYITKRARTDTAVNGEVSFSSGFSAVDTDDSVGTRTQLRLDGGLGDFSYLVNVVSEDNGVERDAAGDATSLQYGLSDVQTENYLVKLGYQIDERNALDLTYNYYEAQQQTDYVNVLGSVNSGEKSYAIKNDERIPGDPQGPRGNDNLMVKFTSADWFGHTDFTLDGYQQTIDNAFFYSTQLADYDGGYEGGQSVIISEKQGLRVNLNTQLNIAGVQTSFTYGLDYLDDVSSQVLVDGRTWVPEMDMQNTAPYLQSKFIFADHWVLKAGLRKEDIEISVDDYSTLNQCSEPGKCTGSVAVSGGKLEYSATTYNVGFRYNGVEAFSPFISYSEGFNISDLGRLLRTATVTDLTDVQTEASIVESQEIGFSGRVDRWRYELAYYQSESELGTGNSFNAATGFYEPTRAPQKIWGYEGALHFDVNESLSLGATYTWVEGQDTETDEYLHGRDIAPPKLTAYIDWMATSELSLGLNMLKVYDRQRFERNAEGNYVGAEGPVNGYQLINAKASYELDNWQLFASAENLLNKEYASASAQAYTYNGYNGRGRGRWINLGVNYSF